MKTVKAYTDVPGHLMKLDRTRITYPEPGNHNQYSHNPEPKDIYRFGKLDLQSNPIKEAISANERVTQYSPNKPEPRKYHSDTRKKKRSNRELGSFGRMEQIFRDMGIETNL